MNYVLLRLIPAGAETPVCQEVVLPRIETLKSLSATIKKAFSLPPDQPFEYEVLGCRAPGSRGRLRDLLVSGITRFRYLPYGPGPRAIDIEIVVLPNAKYPPGEERKHTAPQHPAGLRPSAA